MSSSSTPARKINKSNESEMDKLELKTNNDEPQWMKVLKSLMTARIGDIKGSIAEQIRRLANGENVVLDHRWGTDKKVGSCKRQVDESGGKHSRSIQHMKERLTKWELGEGMNIEDGGGAGIAAAASVAVIGEWVPLRIILGGWTPKAGRGTIVAQAKELKDMVLELYAPPRVEEAAFMVQQSIKDNGRADPPTWAALGRSPEQ